MKPKVRKVLARVFAGFTGMAVVISACIVAVGRCGATNPDMEHIAHPEWVFAAWVSLGLLAAGFIATAVWINDAVDEE